MQVFGSPTPPHGTSPGGAHSKAVPLPAKPGALCFLLPIPLQSQSPLRFCFKGNQSMGRVSQAARFRSMEDCPKLCPSVMFWFRAGSEPTAITAAAEKSEPNKPAWGTPSTLTCSLPALCSIVFSTFGSPGFFFLSDFLILTFHAADTGIKGVTWAPLCQLRFSPSPAANPLLELTAPSRHHLDTTWTPSGHHLDTIWTPSGHQPAMKLIGMKTCIWDWAPTPERSTQICFAKLLTDQSFERTAAILPTETPSAPSTQLRPALQSHLKLCLLSKHCTSSSRVVL